jgi:hypothetical protein
VVAGLLFFFGLYAVDREQPIAASIYFVASAAAIVGAVLWIELA